MNDRIGTGLAGSSASAKGITGLEKAAILISTLPEEKGIRLLKLLKEQEVEKLIKTLVTIDMPSREVRESVLKEAIGAAQERSGGQFSPDQLQGMLKKALTPEQFDRIRNEVFDPAQGSGEGEINRYEGYDLKELIQRIKDDMGSHLKVVKREIKSEQGWLPFLKRKKHVLYVKVPSYNRQENDAQPVGDHNDAEIMGMVNRLSDTMDRKLRAFEAKMTGAATNPAPEPSDYVPTQEEFFRAFTGDAHALLKRLVQKDVEPAVAQRLVEAVSIQDPESGKLALSTPSFREALKAGLKRHVNFSNPLQAEKGRFKIFTFVGPTGVGKTSNLFKLASDFVINQGLNVVVISTDTLNVGTLQQARAYAGILNVPFYVSSDTQSLINKLQQRNDIDVVLIDTVGRSPYDNWHLGEIKKAVGDDDAMQTILVLSCNYKNRETIEIVNRFRTIFPIDALFFTKIDETRLPGTLANLPVLTGIPVSYISTGQRVPEDFKPLDADTMTAYLLDEAAGDTAKF